MTDQEKRALSERLATLAEAQGLPTELVRGDVYECSAGHPTSAVDVGWHGGSLKCAWFVDIYGRPNQRCNKKLQAVPRDLTNPTHLLPLVEAWRDQDRQSRTWGIEVDADETIARAWDAEGGCENWRVPPDDDPIEALAQALCAVL